MASWAQGALLCCLAAYWGQASTSAASASEEACAATPPVVMVDLIERKRVGQELEAAEIRAMVQQFSNGTIPDYQMTAMLMAVFFRGMTEAETAALTNAFTDSGDKMDWSLLPAPAADKHSTGGVGDKVSLILAPLAASLGLLVPMMSGRSLGHTGGTLNKLESIPGLRTDLSEGEVRQQLSDIGVAIFGATTTVAPADKRVYSLRDQTGTVNSLPLITSSIMSKKIAGGAKSLVLDVKSGRGALMSDIQDCIALAQSMVAAGENSGIRTVAMITSMAQPLGSAVGNWLEVREAIQVLRGAGPSDVRALVLEECAQMLLLAGRATSLPEAREKATSNLDNGAAYKKFQDLVGAQGGSVAAVIDPDAQPLASVTVSVRAASRGIVTGIDALSIAQIGHRLARAAGAGAGKAGVLLAAKIGDRVEAGGELAALMTDDAAAAERETAAALAAFEIAEGGADHVPELISHVVTRRGVFTWEEYQELGL